MRRPDSRKTRLAVIALSVVAISGAMIGVAATAPEPKPTTERAAAEEIAPVRESSYSQLVGEMEQGEVASATIDAATGRAEIELTDGTRSTVVVPADDGELLRQLTASGADVTIEEQDEAAGGSLLVALIPTLVMVGVLLLLVMVARRRMQGAGMMGGGGSLSKAAEVTEAPRERFSSVAGADEAVEELQEVVAFFEDPGRFQHLGAKLPSGVILYGEPGTGKTLLARALAGEAGIPFFAASGSDFVEKFVGVGASRVRELFQQARSHPEGAVVFIDEIDAVGRARGGSEANSEREQTLNQILVEMDGFSGDDRVVVIAATNRLDVLDPALLRPGRFGRHIAVPLPAAAGRAAILRVHADGKPLAADVDLDELAESMGGLSGAQLAEVVNEAAIMAGRAGSDTIGRADFREAFLRVLAGPKRRNAPLAEGELEAIAYHEAGHVLAAEYGRQYEKAQQVTVEPRGQAMGLAVYGQVDRALQDPEYLHEAMIATLGGRAAEQIVLGRVSSGAANDLQKATELARRAVEEFGFSPRLGQIVAGRSPFSETTRAVIDSEIERMVADAYADALEILGGHREQLDRLTARLMEQRALERVDILAAIGPLGDAQQRAPRQTPRSRPTLVPNPVPMAATTAIWTPASADLHRTSVEAA